MSVRLSVIETVPVWKLPPRPCVLNPQRRKLVSMLLLSYQQRLAESINAALSALHVAPVDRESLISMMVRPPSAEKGDLSIPVFRFMPKGKNPAGFAQEIVHHLKTNDVFSKFEAAGPYVNVFFNAETYSQKILENAAHAPSVPSEDAALVMVEYASPNTNKPLHVGHLRNLAIAESIIRLFEHSGKKVIRAQVINDRGVHICKSMLAYQKWGRSTTPESQKMKSDHFVGKWYTEFSKRAENDPTLEEEAQAMLVKWEHNDKHVRELWKKNNDWAVKGMFQTYARMGATFDVNYYESEFYQKGKDVVLDAYEKGLLKKADNGAIIVPLEKMGLPDKPVIRGDGTSLYFTQDIYLAMKRFADYPALERIVYVVASEQEMHFKQLFATLKLLGVPQAEKCYHLGYGLLTLPSGKMSSRAGTVVNADELMDELLEMALNEYHQRSPELDETEIRRRANVISLAALKFYLVKQDAKKELVFDPKESISFDGQTGPYLLYTTARILSILRKSTHTLDVHAAGLLTLPTEKILLTILSRKDEVIASALRNYSPHVLGHYLLDLANTFNTYYHETKIIQENEKLEKARLALANAIRQTLEEGLYLLGIETLREM